MMSLNVYISRHSAFNNGNDPLKGNDTVRLKE